jgi:ribosomal protein S27E
VKIAKIEKVGEDADNLYLATSLDCPDCKENTTIEITGGNLFAYHNGMFVHEIFPDMSPDIRERFISGYCPECWNKLFNFAE